MGRHDATHVFCWPSPRTVAVLKRDFDLLLFWEIKAKEKDDSFFPQTIWSITRKSQAGRPGYRRRRRWLRACLVALSGFLSSQI